MADELVENDIAMRNEPHIEIEEKRGGGEVGQGGKFRQRPACEHLLKRLQLAIGSSLIEKRQRIGKTQPVMATHQRFITENRACRCLDNRLKCRFQHQLCHRKHVPGSEAPDGIVLQRDGLHLVSAPVLPRALSHEAHYFWTNIADHRSTKAFITVKLL